MKPDRYRPMRKSQWHLLFWSCLVLAGFTHINFCEWAQPSQAQEKGLHAILEFAAAAEGESAGMPSLYSDSASLTYTPAFICGVLLPVVFLIGAIFLLFDRPRPHFPPLSKYLKDLQTGDETARSTAAGILLEMSPRIHEGIDILALALKDDSLQVRLRAAATLARIGPEARDAIPALVEGLSDEAATMRERCARALGKMGPEAQRALPLLEQLLMDENELVRLYALEAIQRIKGERSFSDSSVF